MAMLELRDRWSPFRLLEEIRRDFEELEDRLFGPWFGFGLNNGDRERTAVRPVGRLSWGATDIYEKDGKLVFETELPGVTKDDVSVRVQDGRLVITAEVKRTEEIDEQDYYYMGRRYGRVQRVFQLPEEAAQNAKKIEAHFENGILKVEVPLKKSLRKPETIEIKVK